MTAKMTKNFAGEMGIFLFKAGNKAGSDDKGQCQLKNFINFLNFAKAKKPIKVCPCGWRGQFAQ